MTSRINLAANLILPCDVGEVSDGYHTFNELYEHRHALFIALMQWENAWISRRHFDGSIFEGWFIAGIDLPTGTITYHLPERLWSLCMEAGATVLDRAPEWDGHTPRDAIDRLHAWVGRD